MKLGGSGKSIAFRKMIDGNMWYYVDQIRKLALANKTLEPSKEENEIAGKIIERMNYLNRRIYELRANNKKAKDLTEEEWDLIKEAKYAFENVIFEQDGSISVVIPPDIMDMIDVGESK